MPRTPVAATARQDRISVRATADEVADLDRLRKGMSRSDFIRDLLHRAVDELLRTGRTD